MDLQTDLVPGHEFTAAEVFLQRPGTLTPLQVERAVTDSDGFLEAGRLAEFQGLHAGLHRIIVHLRSPTGTLIAERPASVEMRKTRLVTIVITRDCRGVTCDSPEESACLQGQCVPDTCTPETPDACPSPGCQIPADCAPPGAECAQARCSAGTCLLEPRTPELCGSEMYCDPELGCRTSPPEAMLDAGVPDAGRVDAGRVDAMIDGPLAACPTADSDTLLLMPFDPDESTQTMTDTAGGHNGTFDAPVLWTDGPTGCGRAVLFPSAMGDESFGVVPNSPDWDLAVGSVDLWIRTADFPGVSYGIVSRDASGRALPGHLNLELTATGYLALRLQQPGDVYVCSNAPISVRRWIHVGINLGPPVFEMYVDGVRATNTSMLGSRNCGGLTPGGIDGNTNPWVLGANNGSSTEGTADSADVWFRNGAMDHFRVSSVRRDFTVYATP